MKCCSQCEGLEQLFDAELAERELREYHQHGAEKTTRVLLDTLTAQGIAGMTLLDIGGGVGAIQHQLLQAGAAHALHVDASTAYLHAARQEAQRLGHTDRAAFRHGDFVALAPQIEPADIVTLDRVICCYPDMPALVSLSAARAQRFYALVYPRDAWWAHLGSRIINLYFRVSRSPMRFFVHPAAAVETMIHQQGLTRIFHRNMGFWQVLVYTR